MPGWSLAVNGCRVHQTLYPKPFKPYANPVQVLTLANEDRILTPQMKAMFEAENLNNASPMFKS